MQVDVKSDRMEKTKERGMEIPQKEEQKKWTDN